MTHVADPAADPAADPVPGSPQGGPGQDGSGRDGTGQDGRVAGAPTLSVVVCAYTERRWSATIRACASVRRQLSPGDELVIVVDHNPALLARIRSALPGTRAVANDQPRGLSGARNCGVAASRGDVVAFLDDDAVAGTGWLGHLRTAFLDPAVMVAGTAVVPAWAGDRPPRWFPAEFGWVVGCSYRGLPTGRGPVRNPIGASMAVRRTAFALAGGFSELVGRVGTLPVGCEETEFCIRLSRRLPSAAIVYEPGASVEHSVPCDRQTLRYFLRRCYHEGRSKRAVSRLGGARQGLSAERRYVRVVLPAAVLAGLWCGLRRLDVFGPGRAVVIIAGLAAAVAGFLAAAAHGFLARGRHRPVTS